MEQPDPDREQRVQALARDPLARQFIEAAATAVRHRDAGFPFTPVGGGWLRLPPGAHTDDTDMALGLLSALREADYAFDDLIVARNFADWVASRPPDVGASIRAVVGSPGFRTDPYAASRAFYESNRNRCANGALMRNAIVAAVAPDLPTAFEWALKQGVLTHYAPLSVVCCCLQAWLVFETFEGRWPFAAHADWRAAWHGAWTAWVLACADPVVAQWLEDVEEGGMLDAAMDSLSKADFDPDSFDPFTHPDLPAKQGWVLLSLQVAVWAMQWCRRPAKDYPFEATGVLAPVADVFGRRGHDAIGWIPLVGHDSDTYGAIAGPMIAAACGRPFPRRMTETLAVKKVRWLYRE
ncbi:MAG TPA: ADP-ribosylglycohydrolase family protein [Tepidisphaeraceae bacterium]|jgi:hypothetical protein